MAPGQDGRLPATERLAGGLDGWVLSVVGGGARRGEWGPANKDSETTTPYDVLGIMAYGPLGVKPLATIVTDDGSLVKDASVGGVAVDLGLDIETDHGGTKE